MSVETFIPTGRDLLFKSSTRWLKFKRIDDNIGPGLWRIHNGLYDFREFAKSHPGTVIWTVGVAKPFFWGLVAES